MTNRLREALVALGLATSAQVSERLAPQLSMRIAAPTLLRRLRAVACPPPKSVRILGVDDWAWKKGQTYGTILVDLEKRCPIELLSDREEETLTAWLLTHPEIEVISRDRAGGYAAAAKKGAPQAKPIADKFHSLKNLRDGLKELMARKQKVLPEVEEVSSDGFLYEPREYDGRGFSQKRPSQTSLRSTGGRCQKSHAKSPPAQRMVRLLSLGARCRAPIAVPADLAVREIARRLHMSRQTVHKSLVSESFPERSRPPYQGSILDPYKPYILDRRIGWVLEWLPALLGSQRTWLHWLRGLVSPLHFERAQATSGKLNTL